MAKKFYDILPPKAAHKVGEAVKELVGDGRKKKQQHKRRKDREFSWKPVFIVVGVVVLLLVVYLLLKLPRADVQIWPKTEVLSFQQKITIDKTASEPDLLNNIIPAKYLEEQAEASEEYPATGNASDEGKATGTVIIYNKCDRTEAFSMKTGTHFLSDSGKYFVTLQKVVIPAGKKSGGKVTPGSIEAKVEAAEGGDNYNIKPSSFVVPKLSGTSYYYCIYAESKKNMEGGFSGQIKKVTEDDIQSAKDSLTAKLADSTENAIRQKIGSDYILLDNAVSPKTITAASQSKAGAVADKFTYQASVKTGALVFKKSDLEKYAKDYVVSQMADAKNMLEDSFGISYNAASVDMESGKAELSVEFSARVYDSIDKNSFAPLFRGRNAGEISEIVSDSVGGKIDQVKVNFWPFWVKKAPKSQKAIKIELKFN